MTVSAAHAQVGKRNFFEPLVAQDPNPSNELDLLPEWLNLAHGDLYTLTFSLEKQLRSDFSVEIANAWADPSCDH